MFSMAGRGRLAVVSRLMNLQVSRNALAVAVLACAVSCSKPDNKAATARQGPPRSVKTVPVVVRPMERVVTVTGILAAEEAATLSVKIAGV